MLKNKEFDKTEYFLDVLDSNENKAEILNLNNSHKPTVVNFLVEQQSKIKSPCPYLKQCGNCKLLQVNYQTQLQLKQDFIKLLFNKHSNKVKQIEGMFYPFKYRNKVHLSVSMQNGKTVIGFIKEHSSFVSEIPSCLIHDKWFEDLYVEIKKYIKHSKVKGFNKQTGEGELRYVVARHLDGQLLVTLVATKDIFNGLKQLYNGLKEKFKNVCLYININTTKSSAVLSNTFIHKFGDKTIQASMCGIKFNLSPKSFLQVNTQIATKIFNNVAKILNLKNNQAVIDCFSGIGISSMIFAKQGAVVESIEIEKNACNDAKMLAKNNNLSEKIKINQGDCNVLINDISKNYSNAVMFTDPPRSGLGDQFINSILNSDVKKIVYLSCNPLTLKTDIEKILKSNKFEVESITPYDMFPQTKHVEVLAVLNNKNTKE